MKATGITRRIDELGRIVIPKEIRRTLSIQEGDPLEIFSDDEGRIRLKKYDAAPELLSGINDIQIAVDGGHNNLHGERKQKILEHLKEVERLLKEGEGE